MLNFINENYTMIEVICLEVNFWILWLTEEKKNAGIFVGNVNKSTKFTATNSRGNSKNICKHDKGVFLNFIKFNWNI